MTEIKDEVSRKPKHQKKMKKVKNDSLEVSTFNEECEVKKTKKTKKGKGAKKMMKEKNKSEEDTTDEESKVKKGKKVQFSYDSEDSDNSLKDSDDPESVPYPKKKLIKKGNIEQMNKAKGVVEYMEEYENNPRNWRFRKVYDIYLIKHVMDPTRVPQSIFPVVLKYFKKSKGVSRTRVIENAQKALSPVGKPELDKLETTRAKEILDALNE